MRTLPLSLSLATAAALLAAPATAQQKPVLTVMTYDSFAADWGPGPAIKTAFEAECSCELKIIVGGDGAGMLSRLRLEGARSEVDVVLGLDTALTEAARSTGLFAPHGITPEKLDLPHDWTDAEFLPYDWGVFAFVYDKTKLPSPPQSFAELAASDLKVAIQDPRSSTPGLGLLLWVKAVFGDEAGAYWADLADNILTVTKGWSEAYNLFLEGEADLVLSYTTSPAYHLLAEGDDSKSSLAFAEGNYLQIEVAGMLASSDQPELARDFLGFMLTEPFQGALPETNWMYPAVTPAAGLPQGFETMTQPAKLLLLPPAEAESLRAPALEEWRNALSQ